VHYDNVDDGDCYQQHLNCHLSANLCSTVVYLVFL